MVKNVEFNVIQHRMRAYRDTVFGVTQKRQLELRFIAWDEHSRVVIVILDVPIERGQAILQRGHARVPIYVHGFKTSGYRRPASLL